MKVAIVGSRSFEDIEAVYRKICECVPQNCSEIVSGGAQGIDALAERYAKENDLPVSIFYPDYEKYGKIATIIRNTEIVKYADCVLAFCHNESKGTMDTAKKCLEYGVPLKVYNI